MLRILDTGARRAPEDLSKAEMSDSPDPDTILVNHTDPLALHGLASMMEDYLHRHGRTGPVAAVSSAEELRARLGRARCYFLHENCLGKEDARTFVRTLRARQRHARIGLIIEHRKILPKEEIMTIGTNALICTACSIGEVAEGIDAVYHGSVYFSPRIATLMQGHYSTLGHLRERYGLTPRELDVIQLVGEGQSSKEIARTLNISPRTVEAHRHNILQKCNLKNSMMITQLLNDHAGAAR